MTLSTATVWEVRTTGSQNNGGGYTSGGTDYSQQDAAQLNPTDLACLDTSTTLTSATGGFTSAMVGNIIHITAGTQFTVGWYEITGYTDTNTVTIDRTAAVAGQNATAGTGYVGGAFKIGGSLDDEFFTEKVEGNITYIKAGTYTATEHIDVQADPAGTATTPIIIEGYNAVRGDFPTGDNRPLLIMGNYRFKTSSFYHIKHLRFTTTESTGVYPYYSNVVLNCKCQNTSGTAGYSAFYGAVRGIIFISCEAISDNGIGFLLYSDMAINCYAHNCGTYGYRLSYTYNQVINSIADTCGTAGIDINSRQYSNVIGNTIYNCGTGISGTTGDSNSFINNIIDSCTVGAEWTTETPGNFWDYNCWNNTDDTELVTAGDHDLLATDPLLNAPATGDFTLQVGSPCFDAGLKLGADVGL